MKIKELIEKTEKWEASIYQSKSKFIASVLIISALSYGAVWALAAVHSCF